ncbi:cob(I)yrinic acid a,c-diamide adenosyltransferase [Croceimicrobium sp.]|uniref:cob(I)yrinic acid a,c-diamide adenosyltransferase n=1 Tax=Croceimicrobium sp. TaxID=2828340 RepID=UPI003BACAB16
MKIYTKTGDKGQTSLVSGERVAKNHARIEAYGTVDELNACIAVMKDSAKFKDFNPDIENIQSTLFSIGSHLSATEKNKYPLPEIKESLIQKLEQDMDTMNLELEQLRSFIIPGGDLSASYAHVARTICRRAERRVIDLELQEISMHPVILPFLNRLSDYLFTLARYYTLKHNGVETKWKP